MHANLNLQKTYSMSWQGHLCQAIGAHDVHCTTASLTSTYLVCRFSAAAGVYNALATRLSGQGDSAVSLEERLQALQDALMQVSTHRGVEDGDHTCALADVAEDAAAAITVLSQHCSSELHDCRTHSCR
jgi:hypothetical protein